MLPQGSQVSILVARGGVGLLWSLGRGIRPQFAWNGLSQDVSRVAAGSLGSLGLRRGLEGPVHVSSEKSVLFLSC